MHDVTQVFGELALLSSFAVVVSLLLRSVRLPPVAGLLVVGALVGPHGLSWVGGHGRLEPLAEVGVVLLLFTIGLEFSLTRLRAIAQFVLLGGSLQVGLTIAAIAGVGIAFGVSPAKALLFGFVGALSSTALVLRALEERQELEAPHGRFIVGVLIYQDLIVVAMVLLLPSLTGTTDGVLTSILIAFSKAAAVVCGALFASRYVIPRLLSWVESSRSRELFALALLAICLGTAWLTSHLELSLALGAFLGGVVLADTPFAHRATDVVLPARDVLTSLFFISMGMLFDPAAVLEDPGFVLLLLIGFLLGKGLIASVAAMVMRFPARVAWLAGASLSQFGEFGFILAKQGERLGIVTTEEMQPIFAAGLGSMFVTRMIITAAPRFRAGELLLRPLERLLGSRGIDEVETEHRALSDHVVLVGYGPGGRSLAEALREHGKSYLVMELNAQTVEAESRRGVPIYYGDITSQEARRHAGVANAAAVAVQINDPAAASRAVAAIRSDCKVPIFVRARREHEAVELTALGATCVAIEEQAASARIVDELISLLQLDRQDAGAAPSGD